MGIIEVIFVAIGLSADAFAAALCQGLCFPKFKLRFALGVAFLFGFFQAVMPLIGWLLGSGFREYIVHLDHWIAFALLSLLGLKMFAEAQQAAPSEAACPVRPSMAKIFTLAFATSIDALAAGIGFSVIKIDLLAVVTSIGCMTFALSFLGVYIGCRFGNRLKTKAEIAGGAILIIIGIKILLDHLGVFG